MLAVAVLGFEGAISGNVLWGVAFPAEARGGECDDYHVVWASLVACGCEEQRERCPGGEGK